MTAKEILQDFWYALKGAKKRALMLDYDGTLAPFVVERDKAAPYPGVKEELLKIMDGGTRLVVITGRRAIDIIALLGLGKIPEIWGLHGFERQMPDGSVTVGRSSGAESDTIAEASRLARMAAGEKAVEQKLSGVAVHFRGLGGAEAAALKAEVLEKWRPLSLFPAFALRDFDGGIEMRLRKITKAKAVMSIVSECGEGAVCAYLGDDDTDEDAFKAMKGRGLSVLVRGEYRQTNADAWIRPPDDLLDFLENWRRAAGGAQGKEVIRNG